jgi:hypothetical protein
MLRLLETTFEETFTLVGWQLGIVAIGLILVSVGQILMKKLVD